MLIGLTGKARSGKNTVANVLEKNHGFIQAAFADNLKEAAANIFRLNVDYFYDDRLKDKIIPYWDMSPRKMLQLLGTAGCRKTFGDSIWIKSLDKSFEGKLNNLYYVVVTDVRFNNEADFIRSKGGAIVHVTSGRESSLEKEAQEHCSEAGVIFKDGDFLLDNQGSLEDLPYQVYLMLNFVGEL